MMDGFDFEVQVNRTDRKKSASIEVASNRVIVTVPASVSDSRIRELVGKRTAWIKTKLKEEISRPPSKPKEFVSGEIIGVTPKSVSVCSYKSRWGSCSVNGDLSYNWRIILAPHRIVDYVVVHELCHLLEHNHSPRYWKHVAHHVPDYKDCREWLKHHDLLI